MSRHRESHREIRQSKQHADRYRERGRTQLPDLTAQHHLPQRPAVRADRPERPERAKRYHTRPDARTFQPERRPPITGNHRCDHCPAWIEGRWVAGELNQIVLRHSIDCPVNPGLTIPQPISDWQTPPVNRGRPPA